MCYNRGMKLKEQIYRKLDGARGRSFSGEELAEEFGVSRNAVWKAIKSLQAEGFLITAATNRGYSLAPENDKLTAAGVEKYLKGEGGYSVSVVGSTGSVLDDLKGQAAAGAPAWSVLIAEEQTAGRGRFGRPFYSPRGAGLYIGILLRPKLTAAETLFITTSAAVAVCEAIERVSGESASVKWVNDVFLRGKKACGILTEASFNVESGGLDHAVVGIGINVKDEAFPPELQPIATSVFQGRECPAETRAKLAAELLERFRFYCEGIPQRTFFPQYKQRSFVIGRRVAVRSGNLNSSAEVLDIDENCFLIVRFDDGTIHRLSGGEISIKL